MKTIASTTRQQGAALIMSLIILLVMTLIGIAGMQTTNLEEKMAGNAREQNLAFQAAEAALRDGEEFVNSMCAVAAVNNPAPSYAKGVYSETQAAPDYRTMNWDANDSLSYPIANMGTCGTNPQTNAALDNAMFPSTPRYTIKHYTTFTVNSNAAGNITGYGQAPPDRIYVFHITAKGMGGSANTRTFLRSRYGKRFN